MPRITISLQAMAKVFRRRSFPAFVRVGIFAVSLVLSGAVGPAARAEGATLSVVPHRGCYSGYGSAQLHGTGFTPNGTVRLDDHETSFLTEGGNEVSADANGSFVYTGTFDTSTNRESVDTVSAQDESNRSLRAAVGVRVSPLQVSVFPVGFFFLTTHPGAVLHVRARGFAGARVIYGHVFTGGVKFFGGGGRTRLVRTVRLGSPRGSCGNLDVRARFFPRGSHSGRYTVIFDANRRYVPASTGRALGVFSVALRRPLVVAIGNVALGETTAEVRRTLGRPLSVKGPERGAYCNRTRSGGSPELVYRYPGRLTIGFERLGPEDPCTPPLTFRVDRVSTASPRDRFSNGIHPGSSYRALRRAFHVKCDPPGRFGPVDHLNRLGGGSCMLSKVITRGVYTYAIVFDLRRFKVTSIDTYLSYGS